MFKKFCPPNKIMNRAPLFTYRNLFCKEFHMCENRYYDYTWWGLKRYGGREEWNIEELTMDNIGGQWRYVDGTPAEEEDINWDYPNEATYSGYECGMIYDIERGTPDFLQTFSGYCSNHRRAVCEFPCS